MADEGLFVHIAEAARMLGESQYKVRLFIKSGLLPVEQVESRRTYIPSAAVKALKKRLEEAASA